MTVIAIVGILAAVALPAVSGYLARSKTSEAASNLRNMYTATASYGIGSNLAAGSTSMGMSSSSMGMSSTTSTSAGFGSSVEVRCTVPSSGRVPSVPGPDKQIADFYADDSFRAIGFSVEEPVYFAYQLRSAVTSSNACPLEPGHGYTYTAVGDLDGDGFRSLYELAAEYNGERQLVRSPGLYVVNGIE
jgi:type II secretory pathway pseudopilin PulG